ALIVAFVITTIAYLLNGGIRAQDSFSIEPRAIAHLSLLLSLMALERAWAYYFVDRFDLELSSNGVVRGAGYTDVHVRLPAIAVGLWALLAIVIGLIFPALFQALKVTPAQSSLEAPYISRNIAATRSAYGLNDVQVHQFPADTSITASQTVLASPTINNIRQWDPDPTIS